MSWTEATWISSASTASRPAPRNATFCGVLPLRSRVLSSDTWSSLRVSGHKTMSVFERYNIVDERNLHEAARRLDFYLQEQAALDQEKSVQVRAPRSPATVLNY